MKSKTVYVAFLVCVATFLVVESVDAQNKRIGTPTGTELLIPIGARDLAMGGSSIATSNGVESIYWNPAGLSRMKTSAEGMFSSMRYIADIGVSYGAVGASFGEFGTIALSVKSLDFGDIPLTTEDDPENRSGRFFSPTFVTVGLSFARSLTDAISAGGTLKIISEQIGRASASGFAIDFGVQYDRLVGVAGLTLGVAIKNIGPQMSFDGPALYRVASSSDGRRPEQRYKSEAASFELPSTVEIGLSYRGSLPSNLNYGVNGSFTNNNLYVDEYKLGGEVGYVFESLNVFGRFGVGIVPQIEGSENIFGETFGFGVNYAASGIDLTVDYAYQSVDLFEGNSVISLKFGF